MILLTRLHEVNMEDRVGAILVDADWTQTMISKVFPTDLLAPLGPGKPNHSMRESLEALQVEQAFSPAAVHDRDMASCCLAGLWLAHSFLDEAHQICQDIDTPSGSYWHALMHRREPDYANAAYWLRHVGRHPIFVDLRQAAAELAAESDKGAAIRFLLEQQDWDPFAFNDLCEQVAGSGSHTEMLCRRIQQREWQLLFDYCYRHALKGG